MHPSWFNSNKHNLLIAMEAVLANRVRSFLTALGIIFGVAAVIAMMAVGKGAEVEVLEQIKMVGVNNILILPKKTGQEEMESGSKTTQKYSPGLTILDAQKIQEILPTTNAVCSEVEYETVMIANGRRAVSTIHGVNQSYTQLFNLKLKNNKTFSDEHILYNKPVCLIGEGLVKKLFPNKDPMNQLVKCNGVWYEILDIIEGNDGISNELNDMGISTYSDQIVVPINTLLLRYKNRSLVNKKLIQESYEEDEDEAPKEPLKLEDKHQLNKIVVQIDDTKQMKASVEVLKRIMLRLHNNVEDFKIQVPELLLKQQQQTKNIFNLVLGAIAGISLIVGGIGIMNIMLASVLERTREIGLRQAIGARKKDVQYQFVFEALSISIIGGIIGILLGCLFAWIISSLFEIRTIVSVVSILISFGVSALVGVIFGYLPAKRASKQDPANTLRYG